MRCIPRPYAKPTIVTCIRDPYRNPVPMILPGSYEGMRKWIRMIVPYSSSYNSSIPYKELGLSKQGQK